MNLIDDIYLVTPFCRRIPHFFHDFTDIIHTIVGSGINLDHIHGGLRLDGLTGLTLIARISVYRRFAINRFCKHLCNGSLSGSSGTAKQICVSDTIGTDLILKNRNNMILSLRFIKIVGTVFPI